MKLWLARLGIAVVLWLLQSGEVPAQQPAERHIPIGESPGVSGEESVIGKITDVDYRARTIEVESPRGTMRFEMDDSTEYYLDRSKRKRPNKSATLRDCKVGRTVEVKYLDADKVDWVKIEAG